MKRKLGIVFMCLGALMLVASLTLFLSNRMEARQAEDAAVEHLYELVERIEENKQMDSDDRPPETVILPGTPEELIDPEAFEMEEIEIDDNGYIGFLQIPNLELELPVMADWDYQKLQISPCRFTGSVLGDDLVIMAHNYNGHFGRISKLSAGDIIYFTDVRGTMTEYYVIDMEILSPTAVEAMTESGYDLTLFTCTYGGQSRVTIRCDRVG